MTKRKIFILVLLITLLGGFLRFYKITDNPPSLTGDEISFGYSAYSILKTGRDESGKFLPLVIQSVGDYKNPVPAYLMILPIKLLGLTDFAIRLPNALLGMLSIPVYFLFLKDVLKDKKLALLGSFFLAISSWHIFYSRFAYEAITASFFIMLGIYFFIRMLDGKSWWGIPSAIFFALTMYTSFAPRLFTPMFVFFALLTSYKRLKQERSKIVIFLLTAIVLGLPLVYVSLFQGGSTRLKNVLISADVDFVRYVSFRYFESLVDLPLLFFFWLKRYLNYLQPDFLFFNGLNMTLPGTFGLGLLYLFEFPWLLLGIKEFIQKKIVHKELLVAWFLVGIVPDSLTNNQQHAGRLLHAIPVVIIITTLGAVCFFKWVLALRNKYLRLMIASTFSFFVALALVHALLTFAVHFPWQKGESFDEGTREAVSYIIKHQDEYNEVVFDIRHGIDGPYIISNPHMYFLFYSKYDPHTYQTEPKIHGTAEKPFYKFDNYTFRYINWQDDSAKKGTLFIGSSWSFPEKSLKSGELLEKIYLTNRRPAFYIVSPK